MKITIEFLEEIGAPTFLLNFLNNFKFDSRESAEEFIDNLLS